MFLSDIYKLQDMPKLIVNDCDRVFNNRFWWDLFHLQGITLAFSSTYHPYSNGETGVTNHILQSWKLSTKLLQLLHLH